MLLEHWDYRGVFREPSMAQKAFLLYLLLVCAFAIFKLLRVWRPGLGFKPSAKRGTPEHLRQLRNASSSLGQWIGLTFLSWGLLISGNLVSVCSALLQQETLGWAPVVLVLLDYAAFLSWALYAATFLYFIRWQIRQRLEKLSP